ncbi:predicted protein [Nematostella vectensis]|uniref:RNA helicase aquarius N-terminal domain-containing protein n=1 Tax=Nematostella vectensis TaxID=45351 RepID=A7SZV7_NEMVE|nr:predicted protein [Nematostella vectensis]|eukprot:XP_001622855.1 predicted protein [Nematostella vectensis]
MFEFSHPISREKIQRFLWEIFTSGGFWSNGQYLERYLWPSFNAEKASLSHLLSIMVVVNEKFREGVPPCEVFKSKPEEFSGFFLRLLDVCLIDDENVCAILSILPKSFCQKVFV